MKKYLFILAGLLCLIGQGEVEAKAVKLGRGLAGGSLPTPPPPPPIVCTQANCLTCELNGNNQCRICKPNYCRTSDKKCAACPANATCNGNNVVCNTGYYKKSGAVCGGSGEYCSECSTISVSHGTCSSCSADGKCQTATCDHGYYATNDSTGAAKCEPVDFSDMQCITGYRKVVAGDQACCVPACTGVSCVAEYLPTVSGNDCCCQPSGGVIANCQTQSGNTCTRCYSGYYLQGNTCKTCPDNAYCPGTATVSCNNGYYRQYFPINGTGNYACLACPAHSTCSGETFTCNTGYYEDLIEPAVGGAYWGCKQCPAGCTSCNDDNTCTACAKGYLPNSDGTCSPMDVIQVSVCGDYQVWHPILMKCVAQACYEHCAYPNASCRQQSKLGYCPACETGYYMTTSGGCATCSSKVAHCARCSSTISGTNISVSCSLCDANYHLENGACVLGTPNVLPKQLADDMAAAAVLK